MAAEIHVTLDEQTRTELIEAALSPRGYRADDPWPSRMDFWINKAFEDAVRAHFAALIEADTAMAASLDAKMRELVGTLADDNTINEALAEAMREWIRHRVEDRS